MAVDLSDFQLEGAREFLKSLSLITVGTEKLDPLVEKYYNGGDTIIEQINRQKMYYDMLRERVNDLENNLGQRIEVLAREFQEFREPFLHKEKLTTLTPEVEQEINNMVRDMILEFVNSGHLRYCIHEALKESFSRLY